MVLSFEKSSEWLSGGCSDPLSDWCLVGNEGDSKLSFPTSRTGQSSHKSLTAQVSHSPLDPTLVATASADRRGGSTRQMPGFDEALRASTRRAQASSAVGYRAGGLHRIYGNGLFGWTSPAESRSQNHASQTPGRWEFSRIACMFQKVLFEFFKYVFL